MFRLWWPYSGFPKFYHKQFTLFAWDSMATESGAASPCSDSIEHVELLQELGQAMFQQMGSEHKDPLWELYWYGGIGVIGKVQTYYIIIVIYINICWKVMYVWICLVGQGFLFCHKLQPKRTLKAWCMGIMLFFCRIDALSVWTRPPVNQFFWATFEGILSTSCCYLVNINTIVTKTVR